jgi:hypothetical protein
VVVAVGGDDGGQGGVGDVDGDRAGTGLPDQGGQFGGVGGEGNVSAERFVVEGLALGAHGDGGALATGQAPGPDCLGQQIQCRQQHQNPSARGDAGGGAGGDEGLAGAARGDHARPGVLGEGADGCADGFLLVRSQLDVSRRHALLPWGRGLRGVCRAFCGLSSSLR